MATLADGVDNGTDKAAVAGQDDSSRDNFHLKAKNLKSVYLMPSISIYDNAAVYVKVGRSIAELELTGAATGAPGNLQGDVLGIGTIAMTPSGIFIKTEGTVTTFEDIRIVGLGNSASAVVEGNPDVVAGTVSIGFKF